MKKDNSKNINKKAVGIASLAVAASLGAYFLYGTESGKKSRKKISGWMLKAKGEVLDQVENLKDVTEEKYSGVVKKVLDKYKKVKKSYGPEIEHLSKELISYWKNINSKKSKKK